MKRLVQSFKIAFSMYSVFPIPHVEWKEENMRYVFCFFPLVGLLIGGAIYFWIWFCAWLGLSAGLFAAGAAAIPVLLSGGIHMDGFCDTCDALGSHAPLEKKLEILKDPHIGAFGVMGCALYLLLTFGLWTQFPVRPETAGVVGLGFMLSRALSGFSVVSFRCAKKSGLAASFSDQAQKNAVLRASAVYLVICSAGMLYLSFAAGALAILASMVVLLYYKWMAYRYFEGITGDLAGYFLQMCEIGILISCVLLGGVY